jgi:hypothetical protein
MRLSISRRIFDVITLPLFKQIEPSLRWWECFAMHILPMPYTPKMLASLPSLWMPDDDRDLAHCCAQQTIIEAKANLIKEWRPSTLCPAFNHVKALMDHIIPFVRANILTYFELKMVKDDLQENLRVYRIHNPPPMYLLASGDFVSVQDTTYTTWDDKTFEPEETEHARDINVIWNIFYAPCNRSALK